MAKKRNKSENKKEAWEKFIQNRCLENYKIYSNGLHSMIIVHRKSRHVNLWTNEIKTIQAFKLREDGWITFIEENDDLTNKANIQDIINTERIKRLAGI